MGLQSEASIGRVKAKRIPSPKGRWGPERADEPKPDPLRNWRRVYIVIIIWYLDLANRNLD